MLALSSRKRYSERKRLEKEIMKQTLSLIFATSLVLGLSLLVFTDRAAAAPHYPTSVAGTKVKLDLPTKTGDVCGTGKDKVKTSINIGCRGKGSAAVDMLFAVIRFLSNGVGLVIIGSVVYGGIQYTMSRGDPQSTVMAVDRIRNSLFALLLFLFAYAFLNFVIPAGFLK
jgi:hypothetical protein